MPRRRRQGWRVVLDDFLKHYEIDSKESGRVALRRVAQDFSRYPAALAVAHPHLHETCHYVWGPADHLSEAKCRLWAGEVEERVIRLYQPGKADNYARSARPRYRGEKEGVG